MGIVRDRIGAVGDISEESHECDGATDELAARLVRQVIGYGDEHGFYIRPQSVRVKPHSVDGVRMTRRYHAEWYPNPRDGVLFSGGPWDGEQRAMDYDDAPRYITLVAPPQPFDWSDAARNEAPLPLPHNPEYARAGIDPARDCWVYEFRG